MRFSRARFADTGLTLAPSTFQDAQDATAAALSAPSLALQRCPRAWPNAPRDPARQGLLPSRNDRSSRIRGGLGSNTTPEARNAGEAIRCLNQPVAEHAAADALALYRVAAPSLFPKITYAG